MIWLLLFLFGAAGLTIVISLSKIAAPIRRVYPTLLECPLCTGTWVGFSAGVLVVLQDRLPAPALYIGKAVAFAFSVALVAYLAGTWLREHDRPHD